MDAPTTDSSARALIDEELIIIYLHEKSQAQGARSYRSWGSKDLNRLPVWLKKREKLPNERLELEFLSDFGHYRTSSAIITAYREKKKKRQILAIRM